MQFDYTNDDDMLPANHYDPPETNDLPDDGKDFGEVPF